MGCGNCVSTCVIVITSVVFLVLAAANIGLGAWIVITTSITSPLIRLSDNASFLEIAAYLTIGCGVFLFVVSIMGCCTATCVTESRGCFYSYIALMMIIVAVQCGAVAVAIHYKSSFKEKGEDSMTKAITEGYLGPFKTDSEISTAWNAAQILLQCCGVSGQDDYSTMGQWDTPWKIENAKIPFSCCKINSIEKAMELITMKEVHIIKDFLKDPNCPVSRTDSHTEGCFAALTNRINQFVAYLIVVGVALAVVELFSMIAACFLFPKVKKSPEDFYIMRE
ncbi:tetraspanin-18-like [Gigantopelta aegis]|uniref:tetraspanin-18-like n=1 Tax=Gigantopelta aegis TaxID=1735272 RepID=UPI001B8892CA|nr:tetraspanin-18-like [Gigantopelta aegis]